MKKLVLSAVIIAVIFAAGFQTQAATLTNLPIGSVEKVLNHDLMNTWQVAVTGEATSNPWRSPFFFFGKSWRSYTNADGTTESINALCQRAATGDKTELKALLQKLMREAVGVSANMNDLTLQGKTLQVRVFGAWLPSPNSTEDVSMFLVGNEFVLNGVIPESAYETDFDKAILNRFYQTLFVDGVVRGEVRDGQGNLIDSALLFQTRTERGGIGLGNEVLTGQAGTVQLWYRDKTTQTFNLADGSLLHPPASGALRVDIDRHDGVVISVSNPPQSIAIEYSDDFKVWKSLVILTNTVISYGHVGVADTTTNSARFYRASRNFSGN